MNTKVFLIHGWSVQETTTYQALHHKLAEQGFEAEDVFPAHYVSLEDLVEISDLAKAMHIALDEKLDHDWKQKFHIITHSTGALIARSWIVHHYQGEFCAAKPLKNIVFLAGPHFGSRLAHHGRTMLAQAAYLGETGRRLLDSLELGSSLAWELAEPWLSNKNWKRKGIRPFVLTGDGIRRDLFKAKIFPAGYETGSDMVVRVPAANLNFNRFQLVAGSKRLKKVGGITDIPFCALAYYTHSGPEHGIMNSIKLDSSPKNHYALKLILECLQVKDSRGYKKTRERFAEITAKTRQMRQAFAQLDFRFRDEEGRPIDDYVFKLGGIVKGVERPSKTVVHTHKNRKDPSHFTVFINLKDLEPQYCYYLEFNSDSGSELFSYSPDPFRAVCPANKITDFIVADQTSQIEVILARRPHRNLFVFHSSDDPDLHVRWNRKGEIIDKGLEIK